MMNDPVLNWLVIVSLLLLVFLFRAISKFRTKCNGTNNGTRFFEMGSEEEMFFIPGDKHKK